MIAPFLLTLLVGTPTKADLQVALEAGEEADVLLALSSQVDPCQAEGYHSSAHAAAEHNLPGLVPWLNEQSCPLNLPNDKGSRPQHVAAIWGHHETLKALIAEGVEPRAHSMGTRLIHLAAYSDDAKTVAYVVEQLGQSPDLRINTRGAYDLHHYTPMMMAASTGKMESVVELIRLKATVSDRLPGVTSRDPDLFQPWGVENDYSALALASLAGHTEITEILLNAGANVNETYSLRPTEVRAANPYYKPVPGFTPLMLAAGGGHLDTVQLLTQAGADTNQRAGENRVVISGVEVLDSGHTALTIAAMAGRTDVARWLLEEGRADPDVTVVLTQSVYIRGGPDQSRVPGHTPLMVAAAFGHSETVEFLLQFGLDPERTNGVETTSYSDSLKKDTQFKTPNKTALYIAARYGHADVIRALVAGGALLDPSSHTGPLYAAVVHDQPDAVATLLSLGVIPSEPELMAAEGKPEILYMLEQKSYAWLLALSGGVTPDAQSASPLPGPPTGSLEVTPQVPVATRAQWILDDTGRWFSTANGGGIQIWDLDSGLLHRVLPWDHADSTRARAGQRGTTNLLVLEYKQNTYELRLIDMVTGHVIHRTKQEIEAYTTFGMTLDQAGTGDGGWWLTEPRGTRFSLTDNYKSIETPIPARLRKVNQDLSLDQAIDLPLSMWTPWGMEVSEDGYVVVAGSRTKRDAEPTTGTRSNVIGDRLWWSQAPETGQGQLLDFEDFGTFAISSDGFLLRGVDTGEIVPNYEGSEFGAPKVGRLEIYALNEPGEPNNADTLTALTGGVHLLLHPRENTLLSSFYAGAGKSYAMVLPLFNSSMEPATGLVPQNWQLDYSTYSGDGRWLVARTDDGIARIDTHTGAFTEFKGRGDEAPPFCTLDALGELSCRDSGNSLGIAIDLATGSTLPRPDSTGWGEDPEPKRQAGGRSLEVDYAGLSVSQRDSDEESCRWTPAGIPFQVIHRQSALSDDGRWVLVSGRGSHAILVLDSQDCSTVATLLTDKEGQWAIALPNGATMASARGGPLFAYRVGDQSFPYEGFDLVTNRPDRVLERFGYATAPTLSNLKQAHNRRLKRAGSPPAHDFALAPRVGIVLRETMGENNEVLRLTIQAASSAPLVQTDVLVGGVPMPDLGDLTQSGDLWQATMDIPLADGDNRVRVSVVDSQGRRSAPAVLVHPHLQVGASPTVYFVGIGVSDYVSEDLNDLRSASKDVTDVASALKGTFNFHEIKTLIIRDEEATVTSMEEVRPFLEQAGVDDIVIVYLAGHGMLDQEQQYWFGLHEIEPEHPDLQGLSFKQVEAWLDGLAARKRLVFLDTCNAGDPLDSAGRLSESGPDASRSTSRFAPAPLSVSQVSLREHFADLSNSSGAIVISAASAYDLAQDGEENGAFTKAVLEALAGDGPGSTVTVRDLQAYVEHRVPELTNGEQQPVTRSDNLEQDFELR